MAVYACEGALSNDLERTPILFNFLRYQCAVPWCGVGKSALPLPGSPFLGVLRLDPQALVATRDSCQLRNTTAVAKCRTINCMWHLRRDNVSEQSGLVGR
jgi:hypothetical protein